MTPYDDLLDRFLVAHWYFVNAHGSDPGVALYRRWRAYWSRRDAVANVSLRG